MEAQRSYLVYRSIFIYIYVNDQWKLHSFYSIPLNSWATHKVELKYDSGSLKHGPLQVRNGRMFEQAMGMAGAGRRCDTLQ